METSQVIGHRVSTSGMLKYLGVSRSGYRSFLQRKPSQMQQRKENLKQDIRQIYEQFKQNYGAPKIAEELRKEGTCITTRTVGKYMKEMGIRAQWVKPWIATTKDSDFSKQLHNVLEQRFHPNSPNAVWCTDITYLWTFEGFVYLTTIMDLYARKIIAWTLSRSLDVSCVLETIDKAKARRDTSNPLILHSDRGSQYVSKAYREATKNFQLSYSRKATPYDNACVESFHALLKREWIHRFKIRDYDHAYQLVFEYIETFYNTVRSHSYCGYLSPNEFKKLYLASQSNEKEVRTG